MQQTPVVIGWPKGNKDLSVQNGVRKGQNPTLVRVEPQEVASPTVLEGLGQKVFLDRYSLKDEAGSPVEQYPEQMWARVAKAIARVEKSAKERKEWEEKFYQAMEGFKFIPGGRILAGAGTGYEVTFFNCYVIPCPKDSRHGILGNLGEMVEIMSRGGGVGINFSSLRPRGSRVKGVNGFSSGPVNWAGLHSVATRDIIQQGGCFAAGTRIMTHKGLVPIEELVKSQGNYYVSTHKGYKKVTAKFQNGFKKVYKIETEAGFTVRTTLEHKFVTFDENGRFYLRVLEDIKKGDSLVHLLGDWHEDIPYPVLNTALTKPSKYSYGLKHITFPKYLNEDLAFIVGSYDADGSKIPDEYSPVGKGIRIAVANDRPADLQKLLRAIRRCFNLLPKTRPGDGAVTIVQVFSRRLNEFLKLNGLLKESSSEVTVPELIFTSPRDVVEAYLGGVFLGDGTNRGGKGGLRIATVSKQYAGELQLLLLNLGIASKIKIQIRKERNWKTLYTVNVNGAMFMKRLASFLAPYTEKVFDRPISVRDGAFGWTFNLVERFSYIPYFQRTQARTNPTTSQKSVLFLQQVTNSLSEEDRPDVEFLANCIPDKIVSISAMGEEEVYDLEVEGAHLLSGNGFYTSNSRRGALMLMLWDWHPDIEEFITVKQDLSMLRGANLSVCVSDRLMQAVKNDEDWPLLFPDIDDAQYKKEWEGVLEDWIEKGGKVKIHKTVRARYLWDLICEAAWASAEPGVVFMERYNKWHNNYYFNRINCVNPCGEEGLPPYGVCNLGSLNLSNFVNEKGEMDYKALTEHAKVAIRFLDNVIDGDIYILPGIVDAQLNGERRIGLGAMGLGDALIKMKLRYGTEESIAVIEKIYKTIRDAAYEESADIAGQKGAFPKFDRKKYLEAYFVKQLPEGIRKKIAKNGIRNSVLLMQAPTGSTSLMAGSTSGIEPVYEFSFIRRDRLGEHKIYHLLFEAWKKEHPDKEAPDYFVSANDLTPEEHVRVQAAVQKYTDASISKTVNAPQTHTVEDVKKLYMMAYELGCKGITYMREGSRPGVLSREEEPKLQQQEDKESVEGNRVLSERPEVVSGATYRLVTPMGSAFITINEDGEGKPFEVFINIGKAGSDLTAMATALGRLISTTLRLNSGVDSKARAVKIVEQLAGIGGRRSVGFGPNKVYSLPDAVARALSRHFKIGGLNGNGGQYNQVSASNNVTNPTNLKAGAVMAAKITDPTPAPAHEPFGSGPASFDGGEALLSGADICPECGAAALVWEEGCVKCYSCGHAEC